MNFNFLFQQVDNSYVALSLVMVKNIFQIESNKKNLFSKIIY